MVIIFLLSFVCAVALATQAVHVQRIMRQVKAAQPGILNGMLQFLVLEFGNLAALRADGDDAYHGYSIFRIERNFRTDA